MTGLGPPEAERHRLDPARTAVVVFDMLERARADIEAAGAVAPTVRLLATCRAAGVVVCWARADHRADGAEFASTLTDVDPAFRAWTHDRPQPRRPEHASGSPALAVLAELGPLPSDVDVPKHRWSAFHGTALDTHLRAMRRDTVLLVGGSTHVGVASTAYAARDLDYQVVVVRDCLYGAPEHRAFFVERVFPRMCRVRSVDEVTAMLSREPDP